MNEEIECYADDSTIVAAGKNVAEVGKKLSEDCDNLSDWMASNSF